jgi:hypothetical protein
MDIGQTSLHDMSSRSARCPQEILNRTSRHDQEAALSAQRLLELCPTFGPPKNTSVMRWLKLDCSLRTG